MTETTQLSGSVFRCDRNGIIRDVLRNDLHAGAGDLRDASFLSLFDQSNIDKGALLLQTLQTHQAAFGWEINLLLEGRWTPLHFTGFLTADMMIIACSARRADATSLLRKYLHREEPSPDGSPLFPAAPAAENDIDTHMLDLLTQLNNELTVIHRRMAKQNIELEHLNNDKNALIADLTTALAQIKTLSGLIPICSNCKKIRDDRGYWNVLEKYLKDHSDATFTHGICPDCAKIFYDGLDLQKT